MKRIADLDPAQMTDAQRSVYDAIANGPRKGVRGPLAVWLHRPELAQHAQALGRYCRYDTTLPPRLSELAILTLARVWGSEYEWFAHKPIALEAGVSAEIVEAIRTHAQPHFTQADEALVHAFLTELHRDRKVSDARYAEAVELLGEAGVVDLVGLAGYYTLISMTINVFQVAQPAGVPNELGE
ncbi:4-carboxymuconolactone decarboxylase [Burkholderia sp. SRS-W-2-2016]|uniref:carboxymuconolactone decarboxylase family protein n=1 Tax=Burkholderia sp. SRS-W-2-2016 TaxID=1926878 RepID=UPI00094B4398|nr:carboxymuconolactone decarboxylase family protein [Burkholderia sp. SRS-W-2-2016]OLL33267.1 4-carboxymuconolactone decarboxylase [Burkholderia sp. SRS-W-2-2016]